jgi:hypothetical protein
MALDGEFIETKDGNTIGSFNLRTSLAAEQKVKSVCLMPVDKEKGVKIEQKGQKQKGQDAWVAAADAIVDALEKQLKKQRKK